MKKFGFSTRRGLFFYCVIVTVNEEQLRGLP